MTVLFDNTDLTVEMAFGDPPLEELPTWVDVTAYVRKVDINRGRSSEYSTYSPGTARIELDNRDRRFDPEHTSSPYAGDLVPMVQVRIKAQYSTGVDHYLFRGFVQGWPTTYNQSNTDAVSTVTAIDGGRILNNTLLPANAYKHAVQSEDPFLYFPMQSTVFKERGSTGINFYGTDSDDGLNTIWLRTLQSAHVIEDQGTPLGASNSIGWNQIDYAWEPGGNTGNPEVTIPACTGLEFWFKGDISDLTSVTSYFQIRMMSDQSGNSLYLQVQFGWDSSGFWKHASSTLSSDALNYHVQFTGGTADCGAVDGMNHVVVTKDGSNLKTYLNGSLINTTSSTMTPISGYDTHLEYSNINADPIPISHIAVHTTELSASDVLRHYNAGYGFNPESSDARLNRVLDDAGWPTNWRNMDVGNQQVNAYLPERLAAIRYTDQITAAEQGDIYLNRFGSVESINRTRTNRSIPSAFFDPESGDLPFTAVNLDGNSTDTMRNYVVVNYANGESVAEDLTSINAYGTASERIDARLIDNGSAAQHVADIRLARAKDPRTRITQLAVDVRADASQLVDTMASMELADDVVVAFKPTNVGDPVWRAVRVQGISHNITPESWTSTLYLAPGSTNVNGALFVLNNSTYGELNAGNKLG